ncbi:MAG: hypothetical protein QOG26_1103 [Solirubrobacterales bacterium]|nr:hypothetical protein [Solirubrobacterales bacterium]
MALAVILAIALAAGATVVAKTISGSGRGEFIKGSSRADVINGQGGNDTIDGRGGNDRLFGSDGNDDLYGGSGDDGINGGSGDDRINGGPGNDRLTGGPGHDEFNMADGAELDAQAVGNDVIYANDGEPDSINCGAGDDTAYVDRQEEGVFNCEHVIAPPDTPAGVVVGE